MSLLFYYFQSHLGWDRLAAFRVGGFVGGLLFVVALLFLDGVALLVGHGPVDSLALLLVRGAAGLLVLGLVAGGRDGSATLAVDGLTLAGVDGLVDGVAPRCGAGWTSLGQQEGVNCDSREQTENNENLKKIECFFKKVPRKVTKKN